MCVRVCSVQARGREAWVRGEIRYNRGHRREREDSTCRLDRTKKQKRDGKLDGTQREQSNGKRDALNQIDVPT